MGKEDG
jgi:hypothetical protein